MHVRPRGSTHALLTPASDQARLPLGDDPDPIRTRRRMLCRLRSGDSLEVQRGQRRLGELLDLPLPKASPDASPAASTADAGAAQPADRLQPAGEGLLRQRPLPLALVCAYPTPCSMSRRGCDTPCMSTLRSRWSAIIAAHAVSGLAITGFCRIHGISTASFYRWRREIEAPGGGQPGRSASRVGAPRAPAFVEAVLSPTTVSTADPVGGDPIVELRCGRRIIVPAGFDDATLTRLVGVLERDGAAEARS